MKDTIYFPHDFDAHTDPKIIKLRMKFWWEWYGLYRATLESMRWDADIQLKQSDIDAFAFRLQYDNKKYEDILNYCVEIELFIFDTKDCVYFSKRLQEDAEFMRNKSKKARVSANARWKARSNANALQTQSEGNAIKEIKDIKDIKEKDISSTKKSKLQVEDVVDYIRKFIDKKSSDFLQISSQIKKMWLDAYLVQWEEARRQLLAKGYADEQIKLALEWAIADEFRARQIRTPRKLLWKNPEWVLYIDVMLDVANALLDKQKKNAMR